jgi:uncharacterized protein (DUF1800 family)
MVKLFYIWYIHTRTLYFSTMRYFLIFILSILPIYSQQYSDYIGAGHANGITVTASSSQTRNNWTETAHPSQTINAQGLDAAVYETSRFLAQSTFGTNRNYILNLSNQDFEAWIDAQFLKNSVSIGTTTNEIYLYAKLLFEMNGGNPEDYTGPDATHFLYAWWQVNMNNEDLLRQRVALALSEIFVISWNSNLEVYGDGFGYYCDVLKNNAFGNFEDLMMDVTLHPMMGGYLSHYNNPKTDTSLNIHPDENYAREIMQLFSIGLHQLNQDGSYVLDGNNNRIPTYSNDDIKEFAKVFTGLGPGAVIANPYGVVANFGVNFYFARKDVPMVVYNNKHEYGPKYLLNGFVIPQGQTGMQDVEMAVNHLFNHPNVGPFIAKRLIQQLVKSNPSPSYISRVAAAFNNTNGVRGDMKAVIKAILLDEEARSCDWINHPNQGKLKEPMLRYFNIARQIDHVNPSGLDWNVGYNYYLATGQTPLGSPSVFNFFLPDFSPNGSISNAGLVAPEFQIHNSITSIAYLNEVDLWTYPELGYSIYDTYGLGLDDTILDFTTLKYYAQDTEVLINELDKLFTHGLLSQETRQTIKTAVDPIMGSDPNIDYMHYRVKMAIYLLLISPDYTILK